MQNKDFNIQEVEDRPSKTQVKRHMEDLQKLGMELVELSPAQLVKFEMPDRLLSAILEAQKITSNGAIRRQCQYIGRLMRDADEAAIRYKLDEIKGKHSDSVRKLHECEKWRDRLLASDSELKTFMESYQVSEIGQLRGLIRQVRKEMEQDKQHNYRKLFQFIRDIIEHSEMS